MSEGNGSENGKQAKGPLAKVVRAGAKPGIPEKPKLPAIPEAANAEPKVEQPINVGEETKGNMKSFVKTLLTSENVEARIKGLKLADHFATPEMAADIADATNIRIHDNSYGDRWKTDERVENLANELVEKLFNDDPKTTVDSLLEIYLKTNQVKFEAGGSVVPFEEKLQDHKDVIQALWNDRGIKHPELLRFAEEILKKSQGTTRDEMEETLKSIETLGLPEGIALLEKIANGHPVGGFTREFLNACEAVSTPECIPILIVITEKVDAEHHPRIADLTAKILDINLD